MASTTNYGWTTPDDTSLVKDGAAAIRTLGSSIDSTVFANASAGIAKTIVDAKGDLIVGTGSDTVSRLGVGTNGQALVANSATATGLEWALPASGGMTLLSTTTLSGATVTISGISGSYNSLFAVITGVTNATGDAEFRCAPNNDATITNYSGFYSANAATPTWRASQDGYLSFTAGLNPSRTETNNIWTLSINNYSSTSGVKNFQVIGGANRTTDDDSYFYIGRIRTTSAITSLVLSNAGGDLSTGTVLLYGVK